MEFYALRHTSITSGAEADVPVAVMRSLCGHMTKAMTDYYTTVRDQPKAQAVAAIEAANPELLEILGLESPQDSKQVIDGVLWRSLWRFFLPTSQVTEKMEALGRVELPTNGLGNRCSIHLSYRAIAANRLSHCILADTNDLL